MPTMPNEDCMDMEVCQEPAKPDPVVRNECEEECLAVSSVGNKQQTEMVATKDPICECAVLQDKVVVDEYKRLDNCQQHFISELNGILNSSQTLFSGNSYEQVRQSKEASRKIGDGSLKLDALLKLTKGLHPTCSQAPVQRADDCASPELSGLPLCHDIADGIAEHLESLYSRRTAGPIQETNNSLISKDLPAPVIAENMDTVDAGEKVEEVANVPILPEEPVPSPKSQASEQTESTENGKENDAKKRKHRDSITNCNMESLLPADLTANKSLVPLETPKRRKPNRLYNDDNPYPLKQLARESFIIVAEPKDVCIFCLDDVYHPDDDKRLLKCHGPCRRTFHYQCFDVEDEVNPAEYRCRECESGLRKCFMCGETDENLVKCPIAECGHHYHFHCLMGAKADPTTKLTQCPQHSCYTCRLAGRTPKMPKMDRLLVKCNKCPYACHFNFMCCPAEVLVCPDNPAYLTCWKHTDNLKQVKSKRGPKSKKRSSAFSPSSTMAKNCLYCHDGGTLMVCDQCPFVAHQSCLQLDTVPDGPWSCPECTKGRRPMLLDIVWHKCGMHRIWPCQIVPESLCPPVIQKSHPGGSAFTLRFMGTKEFTYASTASVLPYEIYDPGWKKSNSKDKRFPEGLREAKQKGEELLRIKEDFIATNFQGVPPVYKAIKGNFAVLPAKYGRQYGKKNAKRGRADSFEDDNVCNCTSDDQDPCGPSSDCLNRGIHFECDPKTCPAGARCGNQRLLKRQYPKLKKFYTADRGWALRAEEDIREREVVIEYVGEIITVEERNRRMCEKLQSGDINFYFLDLTKGRVIDAGPSGNLARFANHSCDANCTSEKWEVDGDTRIGLIALRDIHKGEEITFDYRWEYECGVTCRECLCGAEKCRGKIGGKTYVSKDNSAENSSVGE
ncbi:histone-lysine N-methyltransferase NSD2-like [Paramacrobiotus metropolitanus]|uniref:histone-lysine N-methyltransferase NSD2-like n=1 Tax=Paramacrobiotus metropolitanus TaxID=2943436 RepID=UPI0024463F7D|nr:histone-lysine N-methyltransferase NSD2-like [Paramacrobiotus metropolitanus]